VLITTGPFAGHYLFLRSVRTTACPGPTTAYDYDPTADRYTQISNGDGGPKCAIHLTWDEAVGKIVAWSGINDARFLALGTVH